jgi:hypothetical protein
VPFEKEELLVDLRVSVSDHDTLRERSRSRLIKGISVERIVGSVVRPIHGRGLDNGCAVANGEVHGTSAGNEKGGHERDECGATAKPAVADEQRDTDEDHSDRQSRERHHGERGENCEDQSDDDE